MRNDKVRNSRCRQLFRNEAANVMWITAGMMFPMMAMIGSGVDLARYYSAKNRLQQACDAGALAARKEMANTGSLSDTAKAKGLAMFNFNYPANTYGSSNTSFDTEGVNASEIKGTATTTMPATVMKIFGMADKVLNVSCNARLEISNVDIVFVLDTTGSMLEKASSTDTTSKIVGLRKAVMSFFTTIMDAKTPTSRIRIGFVPYSSNVNVGKLVRAEDSKYIGDSNTYQSRSSNWSSMNSRWQYNYQPIAYSGLSAFAGGTSYSAPIDYAGANVTLPAWNGCIEELSTVAFSSGSSVPSGAKDLDISYKPSGGADSWKPHIPRLVYARPVTDLLNAYPSSAKRLNTTSEYGHYAMDDKGKWPNGTTTPDHTSFGACPSEAMRLTDMSKSDKSTVQTYVDNLVPIGGTYHDIGMIWGARWIAPVGIFKDDNTKLPANGLPQSRHIIFMTDGDMSPDSRSYSAYGVEAMEGRITGAPTTDKSEMTSRHNARFLAACNAAKTTGQSTVWVISFGSGSTLNSNLTSCSSPGLAFKADNSTQLEQKFKDIAQRITFLRVSQ